MESPQLGYEEETEEQIELFDQYNDKIIALRTFPLMQQIDEWQTSHFIERLEAMIRSDLKGEEEHGQLHLMTRIHQFLGTTTTQHMLLSLPSDRIEEKDMEKMIQDYLHDKNTNFERDSNTSGSQNHLRNISNDSGMQAEIIL